MKLFHLMFQLHSLKTVNPTPLKNSSILSKLPNTVSIPFIIYFSVQLEATIYFMFVEKLVPNQTLHFE